MIFTDVSGRHISLVGRSPNSLLKGCEFDSRQEPPEKFPLHSKLSLLTLPLLLFCIRSMFVLRQWHIKDPGHSAKRAGGKLHLNTHTPLTQRNRSGMTMLCTPVPIKETSSHATRQGMPDHSH